MRVPPENPKVVLTFNKKERRYSISFDFDVTKAEVLKEWDKFDKVRKLALGKSRFRKASPPKEKELLIVVQFLRHKGFTFKQIHDNIVNSKDSYGPSNYHFLTEFDLQKYYNRNIKKI